jgi:transcriptional regulator with XRE-family HTH domain
MPRRSYPSTNPFAQVRAYYGITQRELAAYLGITEPTLNHLEANRRVPARAVLERLAPLAQQMQPAATDAPLPTAPTAGRPDPGPLAARRAACLYHAGNLRWQLRHLPERARTAARWAQALPGLRAALPPADAPAPAPTDLEARREAVRLAYVRDFLDLQATALDPATLSQWHLLHLRAEALEAEAAALAALLG